MLKFIKKFFSKPTVTRVDVLKKAKEHQEFGLCYAIQEALDDYDIIIRPEYIFSLFTRENALKFGADKDCPYWWDPGVWNTGRMDFLNWLIEQYKNNKTDLKNSII